MSIQRRLAAAALTAVAGLAAVSTGAGPAAAGRLPGGHYAKNLPGGGKVTITLSDESVRRVASVAGNPFAREVWMSGKVRVSTTAPIKGATVTAGYLVGCQLFFGAAANATGGVTTDPDKQFATPKIPLPPGSPITEIPAMSTFIDKSGGGTALLALRPGQAVFRPVINVGAGDERVTGFTFTGASGGVAYSQERFGVSGCAGFAQARALVNVRVATEGFRGNVTMYGKPFSIG